MARLSKPRKNKRKKTPDFLPEELKELLTPEEQKAYLAEMKKRFGCGIEDGAEPVDAADCLERAEYARTEKERLAWIRRARELDPEDIDAAAQEILATCEDVHETLQALKPLIKTAEAQLEKKGFFQPEYIGDFWSVLETRPYMRLRYAYLEHLVTVYHLRPAIAECRKLLRLCKNDNMGVRYRLIALYAYLQEEAPAMKLVKQYGEESTPFLFCMALLKYTLGKKRAAKSYLTRLLEVNPDTQRYLKCLDRGQDVFPEGDLAYGYRVNTIEEFRALMGDSNFLYMTAISFAKWVLHSPDGAAAL